MSKSASIALDDPNYDPAGWLDWLTHKVLKARSDAGLARALGMQQAEISLVRGRHRPIGPALLVRVSELTDLSVREIKKRMWREAA